MKLDLILFASALAVAEAASIPQNRAWFNSKTDYTPEVKVKNGSYIGTHSDVFNQDYFLGVPFGHVTRRFSRASPMAETWSQPRNATDYGNSCYGFGLDQALFPQAEDCLNLNIVRPTNFISDYYKLPVVVYFFGGAYRTGSASRNAYNLSFPVNASQNLFQPVIAVSVNYRVNAFGFLSSSEVAANKSLNQGSLDQRLALYWIKENIAAFGGDPNRVTIWGQSAGAFSVAAQLLAYGGRDDKIFQAGIQQSGGATSNNFYQPDAPIYQNPYNTLSNYFNCTNSTVGSLECLRNVPIKQFLPALNPANGVISVAWSPVIDGDFYQKSPEAQLLAGEFVKVPVIGGNNNDEGTFFAAYNFTSQAASSRRIGGQFVGLSTSDIAALQSLYPADAANYPLYNGEVMGSTFNNTYPWNEYGTEYKRLATILGDIVFIAARRLQANAWAAQGVPFYSYRWTGLANSYRLGTPAPWGPQYGVTHNSEVNSAFDNPLNNSTGNWGGQTPADVHLREFMSRSWISFINFKDPNLRGPGFPDAPYWNRYGKSNPKNLYMGVNLTTTPTFVAYMENDSWRSAQLNFINYNLTSQLGH